MVNLQIKGADQLGDLARQLKAAGESGKGLRREMFRGIQHAAKPMKEDARKAAAAQLPQAGGLAKVVAAQKFSVRTRAGRDPGISIRATGSGMTTDRGYVRHPVYGDAEVWVRQQTKGKGWFTRTLQRSAPLVRRDLLKAMQSVANKIG